MSKTHMPNAHSEYRHRLGPVLTVMVVGHRQARLAERGYAPLDWHLAHPLERVLIQLRQRAARAFSLGAALYNDEPPRFRLLTGVADGTDELAANLAAQVGFELHMLAPGRAADASFTEPEPERAVSLGMKPTGIDRQRLRQEDYSKRDELALSFSDVLVVVWDGNEPFPMQSGAALATKAAILRRVPVVWVQPQPNGARAEVWVTDPKKLTDSFLMEIEVLDTTPEHLQAAFVPLEVGSTAADDLFDGWFNGLLVPFLPHLDAAHHERVMRRRIAQQDTLLGYLTSCLLFVLSMGRTQRPLNPLNWLLGGILWLQVMLNPPKRSAELRIVDHLNSNIRAFHWRDNLMSRLHGFFSGLLRLSLADALGSVRQKRLIRHRDMAADAPDHPVRETSLPGFYHWADAQARVYATRYRDDTWVVYYAAALAVFCAVAGATSLWPAEEPGWHLIWVILEFLLLRFVVGRVLIARFKGWHERWMSHRYVAEQLRLLRIGFPLLVLPDSLRQPIWQPADEAESVIRISKPEAWILHRILVAEGLPQSAAGKAYFRMTHHNDAIVHSVKHALDNNRQYYQRQYHTLHGQHHHLHRLSLGLFGLTFVAVLTHFVFHIPGILFFTAFFPAWGAAIHGILSQNEVSRVATIAANTWQRLNTLDDAMAMHRTITETGIALNDQALAWARTQELRELVQAFTDTLAEENQQWLTLLQHNEPDLPA